MLALLLLLLQPAPPVPPPERDRLEAAVRLWADHSPAEVFRLQSIEAALTNAAAQALADAGARPGRRRWPERLDAMRGRLRAYLPADRDMLDRRALACAASSLAYQLTAEEIDEVRRFMATPAGARFWDATNIGIASLQGCYQSLLPLRASDADFRAIGLRPPRHRDRRFRPGEVVS